MKKLVLIGGGGHCKVILDSLSKEEYDEIVITDNNFRKKKYIYNYKVVGDDSILPHLYESGFQYAFISLGSIEDTSIRKKICFEVRKLGFHLINIIDPSSSIAENVVLGEGIYIGKNAVINSGASIGEMCIINTNAIIEHDCVIGKFTHISIGAILCGSVKVDNDCFIGANSTIRNNCCIASNCIIGMNSCVLKSICIPNSKVYGNPAKYASTSNNQKKSPVYIIAEAGVNHNGSKRLAKLMIDKASEAGVNCIKFQTFKTEKLVSKNAEKAQYQKNSEHASDTQYDMLKKLELSYDDFFELKKYALEKGLDFCSTSFDEDSTEFLYQLNLPFWKIPSGEVTNVPYLIQIAKKNQPIIMSTGMCNLLEIDFAVNIIRRYNDKELILLHCNTEYPTPFEDVNLNAMNELKKRYKVKVGYSDHTQGIEVPIAAVALGAEVIEKHFTLDKSMEGPDHAASLDYKELKEMVKAIRNVEKSLGSNEKKVSKSEKKNIIAARKSIVAKTKIKAGDVFSDKNLTVKRPGDGLSPIHWFEIIGSVAKQDYQQEEQISFNEIIQNKEKEINHEL